MLGVTLDHKIDLNKQFEKINMRELTPSLRYVGDNVCDTTGVLRTGESRCVENPELRESRSFGET